MFQVAIALRGGSRCGADGCKVSACGLCARACPSQCITVDRQAATWECDTFACVYCGVCADVCARDSLSQKATYAPAALEKSVVFMQGELKKKTPAKKVLDSEIRVQTPASQEPLPASAASAKPETITAQAAQPGGDD